MVRDRDRRTLEARTGAEEAAFRVRPSHPGDARSFRELFRGIVAEERFIRTESVRRRAGHYRKQLTRSWGHDQASIVAVAGRRVVGHLSISREEHPVNRHVASIGMMVAPDWRRRGVGAALMDEALRWAREMRVEKLALTVYPDNEAARALYRRFGFVEEGRMTGHSKKAIGYRDEIVMGRWLIPQPGGSD